MLVNAYRKQLARIRRNQVEVVAITEAGLVPVDKYKNEAAALRDLQQYWEGEEHGFLVKDREGFVICTIIRSGAGPVVVRGRKLAAA